MSLCVHAVCAALQLSVRCTCARHCLCKCKCLFVLQLSKAGALSKCNTLMWWLVAGGGRSNSLSEANSMLTSQWCHMLVLAQWASLKANQLASLTQALSTPPPWKIILNSPPPSTPLLEAFEWSRSARRVKGLCINKPVSLAWKTPSKKHQIHKPKLPCQLAKIAI